ncbi:uncharacterized protein LOC144165249 [Haemaphysalis longicornis]
MAHSSQGSALVGYSDDTELRPLKFAEPIPAGRICAVCGYIPRATYSLRCGHTLCEPCYDSCVDTSRCVCPLDDEACATEDVHLRTFPAEYLLTRKVHCWNEANGCHVVLAASQVAEHFRHECQHHVSFCPTCSAPVLRRDVCAHLKSRCTALVLSAASDTHTGTDDDLRTHLAALEQKVERRVGEVDAKLAQLTLETGAQSDKLTELCHSNSDLKEALKGQLEASAALQSGKLVELCQNINSLKEQLKDQRDAASVSHNNKHEELCQTINNVQETLKAQLDGVSAKSLEYLNRKAIELKHLCTGKSNSLQTTIGAIMQSVQIDVNTNQRILTGYDALKQKALEAGFSQSLGEKVYLRRYLMSWGIHFKKDGDGVLLHLLLKLHRGRKDEFLVWPFKKELKLHFIHPETREERRVKGRPDATLENFARPSGFGNQGVFFTNTALESSDIERDGYLQNNQLILRLEVFL